MRHTPFLDRIGVTVKDDVPDHAASIIDSALSAVEALLDWGEYNGRKRRPCPEQPILLAGMPIGMYHCPVCGMMILAGIPHLEPGATDAQKAHELYPLDDYEDEYGCPWPPGYVGELESTPAG